MGKELDQLLEQERAKVEPFRQKFPRLFSQLKYIECEEGWYPLIEDLCEVIEGYVNYNVPEELKDQVHFSQIKQKFGELRVHMNHWIDHVQGAISMAEAYSTRVCEKCGEKGQTYNIRNWLSTLCPKHHEERLNEKSR